MNQPTTPNETHPNENIAEAIHLLSQSYEELEEEEEQQQDNKQTLDDHKNLKRLKKQKRREKIALSARIKRSKHKEEVELLRKLSMQLEEQLHKYRLHKKQKHPEGNYVEWQERALLLKIQVDKAKAQQEKLQNSVQQQCDYLNTLKQFFLHASPSPTPALQDSGKNKVPWQLMSIRIHGNFDQRNEIIRCAADSLSQHAFYYFQKNAEKMRKKSPTLDVKLQENDIGMVLKLQKSEIVTGISCRDCIDACWDTALNFASASQIFQSTQLIELDENTRYGRLYYPIRKRHDYMKENNYGNTIDPVVYTESLLIVRRVVLDNVAFLTWNSVEEDDCFPIKNQIRNREYGCAWGENSVSPSGAPQTRFYCFTNSILPLGFSFLSKADIYEAYFCSFREQGHYYDNWVRMELQSRVMAGRLSL